MNGKKTAALVLGIAMLSGSAQAVQFEASAERVPVQDEVFDAARIEVYSEAVRLAGDCSDGLKAALDAWNLNNRITVMQDALSFVPELAEVIPEMSERFAGQEGPLFGCSVSVEPKRTDSRVVSLTSCYYTYLGGAHPNTAVFTANFDGTGRALSLRDVVSDYDRLYEETVRMADVREGLFDGYEETLKSSFYDKDGANVQWYLDGDGLVLTYSPYELAPYAAGYVDFRFPYQEYAGLLNAEFLPES